MRIAFLCTSSSDDASPRGRWLPIARELARAGHEPHVLMLHHTFGALHERETTADGVRAVHVAQMHARGLPGRRSYFGSAALARVTARATRALRAEAMRVAPDVIHVCKPQPMNGLAGLLAARALGVPLCVDCDDYEAEANRTTNAAQRLVLRAFEDGLPRRAAAVTVNTRFLLQRNRGLGVPLERIVLVPNGVESVAPGLPAAPASRDVLYVGSLSTRSHGLDVLIDAFAALLRVVSDARLTILGDGDDRPALMARADGLGVGAAIAWAGRVQPEDVAAHFARAACSVDPVRDTPAMRGRSPLKVVESLAAGVPVVTGDVGDRREVLGDEAGILVAPGDAAALADGLRRVLTDAPLRARLADGALRRARRYLWSALAGDWMRAYGVARR